MDDPHRFSGLVAAATDRTGVLALVSALGLQPPAEEVPLEAWGAYGVPSSPEVTGFVVAGRAGPLDALLIEVEGDIGPERAARMAAGIRARNPVRLHLFVFRGAGVVLLGTHGPEGDFRHLVLEPDRVKVSDLDALDEMAARNGESGLALALRQTRALDRARVTGLFFRDFRAQRHALARSFSGVPDGGGRQRDRDALALLLLCRLTFLYFLQRRGILGGDDRYLPRLLGQWKATSGRDDGAERGSFYRGRLVPLFFEALNRVPEVRSREAAELGELPYLNGGLFEPHPLERRYPLLDLPDHAIQAAVEGLLERYRFTSREAAGGTGYSVDPEILGRVFEGLMAPGQRIETGSFYTPAPVVHRVVREGLVEYLASACPGANAGVLLSNQPPPVSAEVRRQVRSSLERIRVLDPACGSGAFLLGALRHLEQALSAVSEAPAQVVRREIVGRSLHGVDLLDDAALLCSLRLWLALSEDDETVRPLPNLDRRIRQGDALIEPLDLALTELGDTGRGPGTGPGTGAMTDPDLRGAYRAVAPAARRYLESGPEDRAAARTELADAERRLARYWIRRARSIQHRRVRSLQAAASDRDLFGDPPAHAVQARARLGEAERRLAETREVSRQLDEKGALPFFSFGIHFAHTGGSFDFIVSNPPWVRAHRWPERLRRFAARHYQVCRDPGWPGSPAGGSRAAGAQLDLAMLFLERCSRLLAPGGVLAILVPAKVLRSLYGGSARRMLLRDLEFALIEDHSLDQRSIFRADAFTAVLVLRRPRHPAALSSSVEPMAASSSVEPMTASSSGEPMAAGSGGGPAASSCRSSSSTAPARELRVRMIRRGVQPLEFSARPGSLSLVPGDDASPWLLAPPEVVAVLRKMQRAGRPLGEHAGLRMRRGVMTGANDALVMARVEPKLGDLCRIEAAGYASSRRNGSSASVAARYRAHVEGSALRPLVRGADLDRFRYEIGSRVVWCHADGCRPVHPPARMERYLRRHREALESRAGWKPGMPLGTLFRLSPDTLRPKVAWHDLSDRLRAVALPGKIGIDGHHQELIPLNTVYFLPVDDLDEALLLAAIMNSLPASTFARSIAERAKDARFRFFAWTMACLPLPEDWRRRPASRQLLHISSDAHRRGGLDPEQEPRLDRAAAELFGLDEDDLAVLRGFDRWLRGCP